MTSTRRSGKRFAVTGVCVAATWGLLRVAAGVGAVLLAGIATYATTTERVVSDPRTGLAIEGFDPVAYFIDQAAKPGRQEFELRYEGTIWRFRNRGNLAAFMESPGAYEPRFGGYDPIAIGRGAPTPGNPEIWLISDQKLYLFYSPQTREDFKADPRRLSAQAEARWGDVLRILSQ